MAVRVVELLEELVERDLRVAAFFRGPLDGAEHVPQAMPVGLERRGEAEFELFEIGDVGHCQSP